jgi:5-methyltetrahydrofolate--homocysteine methyltransferase
VLGVSNVSHGLPQRPLLNAAFLAAACARGLDAAIVNPNDDVVMEALKTANQARANGYENAELREDSWRAWLAAYDASIARASGASDDEVTAVAGDVEIDPRSALEAAIARGDSDAAPGLAEAVINSGIAPQDVIGQVLTPTIQRLGDAYGRGEVFLPQMMIAADAMKAAVAVAKKHLPEGGGAAARRVAFATVKGDIHSIGKDICVSLLESQGIEVDDLGVDVALERVVEASRSCDAVCLSALMTTTLPAMRATAEAVMRDVGKPVFVGGAVVTEDWASSIGAGYSADAPGCVRVVSAALGAAEDLR